MPKQRIVLCSLLAALGWAAVAAGPAAAADTVSLAPVPATAPYGSVVRLEGAVVPARQTQVELFELVSGSWELVTAVQSHANGGFSFGVTATRPGVYVARTDAGESPQASVRIRPSLAASFTGLSVVGAPLRLRGRLRPAEAGTLELTVAGHSRTVALDAHGRFEELVSARLPLGRLRVRLTLAPAAGYAAVDRRMSRRVAAPRLGLGARGPAVRFLERRLRGLGYVLRGVDGRFAWDTTEALYAFQKVRGLSRTGVMSPRVWRSLRKARTPLAAVPRGNHIEVDKARQVLFEVRRGRVVRIVHVSTGATGNTPLGRWRVYRKTPGFNSLSMYYSMYFIGGFAMHGYHSVPPWPASHGCVRLPTWFARGALRPLGPRHDRLGAADDRAGIAALASAGGDRPDARASPECRGRALTDALNAVVTCRSTRPEPRPGPLAGRTLLVKDLIDMAGVRTTYGSRIYADHVPDPHRARRAAPARRRRRPRRQGQPARVRLERHRPEPLVRHGGEPAAPGPDDRRARRAATPRRSRPASATSGSGRTPAARSGSRRPAARRSG